MRPRALAACALAALFLPALAHAASEDADARALYKDAQIDFDLRQYEQARDKYEAGYRLHPAPAALYNLGVCYLRMEQPELAARAFRTFISKVPADKNVANARARLAEAQAALEAKPRSPKGAVKLVSVGGAASEPQLVTVAVADFKTAGLPPDLQWMGKSFSEALTARLARSRAVRVVEREYLDQIVGEMKLQSSSLVDERSAVQAGKILGARTFIFGSVSVLGTTAVVRARIVGVERAEVLGAAEAQGGTDDLFRVQADLAKQVASAMAIEAAVSEGAGLENNQLALAAYADLDRLRQLAATIPFFGLDPARKRRLADYQLGLTLADKLLTYYPKLPPAHYYRALFSFETEDFDRARDEAEIAARLQPDELEPALLQGNVAAAAGDLALAAKLHRETTRKFPQDSRGWYSLARVLVSQKDHGEAAASLIAALQRSPVLPEVETNLRALLGGGGEDGLTAGLEPPAAAVARLYQAYWHDNRQAMSALAPAAQREAPRLYLGYYADALASQDPARKEQLFRTALSLNTGVPELHRDLGSLLLRTGRCGEGEKHVAVYVKTALAISDYPELKQAMKNCTP